MPRSELPFPEACEKPFIQFERTESESKRLRSFVSRRSRILHYCWRLRFEILNRFEEGPLKAGKDLRNVSICHIYSLFRFTLMLTVSVLCYDNLPLNSARCRVSFVIKLTGDILEPDLNLHKFRSGCKLSPGINTLYILYTQTTYRRWSEVYAYILQSMIFAFIIEIN